MNKAQICESPTTSIRLHTENIRVAVVGNVDAGKSTLVGTLKTCSLDNGRGKARTLIMKHPHEIQSGRTSTITSHTIGFRANGEVIASTNTSNKQKNEVEVALGSHRLVTLTDLAGHEKYLKTTIHGVSSGFADYALVLVNSRQQPTQMTQHHINLCCSYGTSVIVVFTKIDGCPQHALDASKAEVHRMLRAPDVGMKPSAVRNGSDMEMCQDKMNSLTPVLEISNVTGQGLDLLKQLLFSLPKRRRHEKKIGRPFEFLVQDVFKNVPGVGAVVSGFVNAGELNVRGSGSQVFVGPVDDGTFLKTVAKSAHVSRVNTCHIVAGQDACLAISLNKEIRRQLRPGMVVLKESPASTMEFDADVCVLKGGCTTIRSSYQTYVHVLHVRQSAYVRRIQVIDEGLVGPTYFVEEEGGTLLRPGSKANVRFEFAVRPEYIRQGMRIVFRDGCVRGVGIVTATYPCLS